MQCRKSCSKTFFDFELYLILFLRPKDHVPFRAMHYCNHEYIGQPKRQFGTRLERIILPRQKMRAKKATQIVWDNSASGYVPSSAKVDFLPKFGWK